MSSFLACSRTDSTWMIKCTLCEFEVIVSFFHRGSVVPEATNLYCGVHLNANKFSEGTNDTGTFDTVIPHPKINWPIT